MGERQRRGEREERKRITLDWRCKVLQGGTPRPHTACNGPERAAKDAETEDGGEKIGAQLCCPSPDPLQSSVFPQFTQRHRALEPHSTTAPEFHPPPSAASPARSGQHRAELFPPGK